jgi:hypothetical protein
MPKKSEESKSKSVKAKSVKAKSIKPKSVKSNNVSNLNQIQTEIEEGLIELENMNIKNVSNLNEKKESKKTPSKSKKSKSIQINKVEINSDKNTETTNVTNTETNTETTNEKNNETSNEKNNKPNKKTFTQSPLSNSVIKPFNKELVAYFTSTKSNNKEFKEDINKYQDSFYDIINFSKNISLAKKKSINCIIYHAENSDGVMSANIVVKYLLENKTADDLLIIPTKPSSGKGSLNRRIEKYEKQLKGRNVIILDLQYNKEMLDYIKSLAKDVLVIDDHPIGQNQKSVSNNGNSNETHFIGNNSHASVAYTWKFFYPKKDVPLYVQLIDNDDRKLQFPHLSKYRKMTSFYNYRIFHNPYLQKLGIKFDKASDFENLDSIFVNDEYNYIYGIIGHYYDELANNIKDQVARNARFAYFEGHPVYVLNYNDPVLSRMVGRQMLTNAAAKGEHIDFAVLWGYEYINQCYRVQLVEFHGGKPKYNLPYIAKTLGNIGGLGKGGGGAAFVGNFYWPHGQ